MELWQSTLSNFQRILGTTLGSSGGGNEPAIEKDSSQAKELNIATLKHCFVFSLFSHISFYFASFLFVFTSSIFVDHLQGAVLQPVADACGEGDKEHQKHRKRTAVTEKRRKPRWGIPEC